VERVAGVKRRFGKVTGVLAVGLLATTVATLPAAAVTKGHFDAQAVSSTKTYVALGDSYSSGEGLERQASDYISPTGLDGCHRSSLAYPELVAKSLGENLSTFNKSDFVACSGAYSGDPLDASSFQKGSGSFLFGRDDEQSQLKALKSDPDYVTLTLGGNDIGLATTLSDCLNITGQELGVSASAWIPFLSNPMKCASDLNRAQTLLAYSVPKISKVQAALEAVYSKILVDASNARVFVLDYPQIFTTAHLTKFCPVTPGVPIVAPTVPPVNTGITAYLSYSAVEVSHFNQVQTELDDAIAGAVNGLKAEGKKITLVDINSGTINKGLSCNTKTLSDSDINSVHLAPGSAFSDLLHICTYKWPWHVSCSGASVIKELHAFGNNMPADESFHPKEALHEYMASQVEEDSCAEPADVYGKRILSSAPVAYYRMGDRGSFLCDSSPGKLSGVYAATGITHVPSALPDYSGTAISASGQTGDIATGGPSPITGNQNFTLEGWIKSTGTVQDQILVAVGQDAKGEIAGLATWSSDASVPGSIACPAVYESTLALDTFGSSNCWNTESAGINLWDGSWHFVAISYDSNTATASAFVDGHELGTQSTQAGPLDIAPSLIRIGNWPDDFVNHTFIGDADEIALFAKVLTESSLSSEYKAAQSG